MHPTLCTGAIAGPIIASASLARLALRPALLAGAVHASVRWVRRHRNGAAALLKMLSSGTLIAEFQEDVLKILSSDLLIEDIQHGSAEDAALR